MLRSLLSFPFVSDSGTVDAEKLCALVREWEIYKKTPAHEKAIKQSLPSSEPRLSTRLHQAQADHNQGAKLSRRKDKKQVKFEDLSAKDQRMIEDYECGRFKKLVDALLAEREIAQRYPGAGAVLEISGAILREA